MDISQYKVGLVLSVENKGAAGQKPLKVCSVNIGNDDGESITVVTNAVNVREGSRLVVAPIGSIIINDEGEEITISKTSVGGHVSEGMFCDSRMLGWGTGSAGVAAQVPESYNVGMAPSRKDRATSAVLTFSTQTIKSRLVVASCTLNRPQQGRSIISYGTT